MKIENVLGRVPWGLAVLFLLASSGVCAELSSQPPRWILADQVRVRAGPSTEDRINGALSRGAELILKGSTVGEFCLIEGEGQYGYVACKYLSAEPIARPRAGQNGIDTAQRWVGGNGVTVRDKPQQGADAVGRLSLNAVVKLLAEDVGNGYCEVQLAVGSRGYTACRYLTVTPSVLPRIQGYRLADEAPSPDYNPERAFWLEPSWTAMEQFAEYLKSLDPKVSARGPWPRNEVLEKMKVHLALGLKARKPAAYPDWLELKRKASIDVSKLTKEQMSGPGSELQSAIGIWGPLHDAISARGGALRVINLVRALEFPSIQPSLFRSEAELAPPSTSTEEAAGRFGIVFRQLVTPRPKPKSTGELEGSAGLYDMLSRTQVLVRPVQRIQLFRDGRLRTEPSLLRRTETLWREVDEPMCADWLPGFRFGEGDVNIWRYLDGDASPSGSGNAARLESLKINPAGSLFALYTNIDLQRATATRIEIPVKLSRDDTGFVKGVHMHFDLDGDGIADLAIWEGQGYGPGHLGGPTSTDDRWYRLALVNVAGRWKVLDSDVFGYGCGC